MEVYFDYEEHMLYNPAEDDLETRPIGHYGRLRKKFLMEQRPGTFQSLSIKGQLTKHLADVNERAHRMHGRLTRELLRRYPPERTSPPSEVQRHIEILRQRAEKIVLMKLVYH